MLLNTQKQFGLTTFLVVMAQKMFLLPAIMIKTGGQSSYISMAFMILAELAVLLCFMFAIKLNNNRTFYSLISSGMGKVVGRVFATLMLGAMLFKALILISEIRVFFDMTFTQSFSAWAMVLPIMVFLFIIGTKTLRGIGRLSEISFMLVLFSMVLLFTFVAGNVTPEWLLPVLGDGIKPLLKNIHTFPIWFADIPFMFVFLGKVKAQKRFFLWGLGGFAVGAILVLFFTTLVFATYGDIPDLLDYGNNISNMLLYSSANYAYGRFDILIFCVWLLTIFIQLALVFFGLTKNLKYIANLKDNRCVTLFAAVLIYALAVFVFDDEHMLYNVCISPVVRIFAAFNLVIVPLAVIIISIRLHKKAKANLTRLATLRPIFDTNLGAGRIKRNEI